MYFEFTGKGVNVTPAMKEHAIKKISHLQKYASIPDDSEVRVVAKVYNTSQKVEISVPTKTKTIRAEDSDSDFYIAVNNAVKKLEDQCRRIKTRNSLHGVRHEPDIEVDFDDSEDE
jgi:putative sigma-54 modulation protein